MKFDLQSETGAAHRVALFVAGFQRKQTALRWVRNTALSAALAVLAGGALAQDACVRDEVRVVSQSATHLFSIEVADTAKERAQGLMFRESMPESHGMLFVYANPAPVNFWMKNTLIPLDMIFTDQRGVIVTIHENAIPLDETPIFGGEAIFSVLELKGGVSKAKNIKVGDVLLHPAYDFYTSVPCEAK